MKIIQSALLGTFFATLTMATPITFTFTTTPVTGTIGATPFSNRVITITAVGDTSTIVNMGGNPLIPEISISQASFSISGGVGSGTLTTPGYVYDDQTTTGKVVYGSGSDLVIVSGSTFLSYALTTSLGQTTSSVLGLTGGLANWSGVGTSLGSLTVTGASVDVHNTFAATTTPEPSTLFLTFGAGLLLLSRIRRPQK